MRSSTYPDAQAPPEEDRGRLSTLCQNQSPGFSAREVDRFFEIKPRLLVCFSALFALGSSLIVYQVELVFLLLPFLVLLLLRVFDCCSILKLKLAAIALVLGMGSAQARLAQQADWDIASCTGRTLLVNGEIEECNAFKSGKGMRVIANCAAAEESGVHGHLLLNLYSRNQLNADGLFHTGDRISFMARLANVDPSKNAFGNAAKYVLGQRHIFCQASVTLSRVQLIQRAGTSSVSNLDKALSFWRGLLVAEHRKNLGLDNGNLLASMVLGDKAVEPGKDITESFRASGLSHVLAASGFNLSVVATAIYFLARYAGNICLANGLCFSGMLCFVFIAGPSPSVVRAFLMGAVLLLARSLLRSAHMPAVLSLSILLVMLVDPATAADVGFQLSYFATAGMIIGANELTGCLNRMRAFACPEWVKVVLAGTLVAQACVLPLQVYYFKQLNPYCLIANVIVTPCIPAITIAGFASSFCFAVEHFLHLPNIFSAIIDKPCYYPLELIRFVVHAIAALPYAQTATVQPCVAAVLFYYFGLICFPLFQCRKQIRLWLIIYSLLLAGLMWKF